MKIKPTGVNLVTGEISSSSPAYTFAQNIAKAYPGVPFPSGWKANIRGVALENLQPVRKAL